LHVTQRSRRLLGLRMKGYTTKINMMWPYSYRQEDEGTDGFAKEPNVKGPLFSASWMRWLVKRVAI
jgi:hypothetical protein